MSEQDATKENKMTGNLVTPQLHKQRISDAVHHAVCAVMLNDGHAQCMSSAWAGWGLLSHLGIKTYLQVGDCRIQYAPGKFAAVLTNPNQRPDIDTGKFHAWLARDIGPRRTDLQPDIEIIDFAARHYKRYVEDAVGAGLWTEPDPPEFIWNSGGLKWADFIPDQVSTNRGRRPDLFVMCERLDAFKQVLPSLWCAAVHRYESPITRKVLYE